MSFFLFENFKQYISVIDLYINTVVINNLHPLDSVLIFLFSMACDPIEYRLFFN